MSSSGQPDMIRGRCLVAGRCDGELLWLDEPLSFWGGFDPETGTITEARHPQHGAVVARRVLVLPGTVYDYPGSHFRIGFGRESMSDALSRLERFAGERWR